MAITVHQSPGTTPYYDSMNAPHWHVVSSTNSALQDFRYIFDVTIIHPGPISEFATRLKVFPDENGQGVVDVARVIRAYLTNYFAPDTSAPPIAINTRAHLVVYLVEYGEEYRSGGVIVTDPALDDTLTAGVNSYALETPGSDFGILPPATVLSPNAWITSRDLTDIWISRDAANYIKPAFLSYANYGEYTDFYLEVQEITEDGTPTGSIIQSDPIAGEDMLMVLDLGLINDANYGATPTPIITAAMAGFRVRFVRAAFPTAGDWAYVRFLCEPKQEATPIHFLNRYGGFDTFHFTGPTKRELTTEVKTYQQRGVTRSAIGGVYKLREYDVNTNVYAETTIQHNTWHTWTRKLSSGFIDDATHNWLVELLASPQVYLWEDGYYYPVQIVTRRWTERQTRVDKMYNLELEVQMGRKVTSQSR